MDQGAQGVFTPGFMTTFRSARKLSSLLVRAKLYPLERTVGSCKCYRKRCEVCDNVTETSTFTSTVTQNTYKINHQFNCSEKCLVYLLKCNKCFKQNVRQTGTNSVGGRITINLMIENSKELNLACSNIFLVIYQ